MKSHRILPVLFVLALAVLMPSAGQAFPAGSATPIEALSFMAGVWTGQQGTTLIEEHWSTAQGKAMMGMFRLVSSGTPIFYEFMQIEKAPTGITLRIRHFGPGMTDWKSESAAMTFALSEYRPNVAIFKRIDNDETLTYNKTGEEFTITLSQMQNGKPSESVFHFRRGRDKKPEPLPSPAATPTRKKPRN